MTIASRKQATASHVYSQLTAYDRREILARYANREPMTRIAKSLGLTLRVVRTFITFEIQAKRIKEQLDLRQLEREITKAKKDSDALLEKRLGNVKNTIAPRASDQYLHDKRAAKAGSRKLLEALHRYFAKREAEKAQGHD